MTEIIPITSEQRKAYAAAQEVIDATNRQAFENAKITTLAENYPNKMLMVRWSVPHAKKDELGNSLPAYFSIPITEAEVFALLRARKEKV